MIRLAKFLTAKLWQALLLLTILIGITIGTVQLLAPSISNYQGAVAAWIEAMLAQPVQIGNMALHWRGFGPRLILQDVVLLDHNTLQPNLQFAEIQIDFTLLDVLSTGIAAPRQITISGAKLRLKQHPDGTILLDGLKPLQTDSEKVVNPLQLLPRQLKLRDSLVFWENQTIGAKPIRMENVKAYLVRDEARYQLDVSLNLPDNGGQIQLAADVSAELTKSAAWSGEVYFKGNGVTLSSLLKNHLPNYALEQGEADLELWSSWNAGRMSGLKGQISLGGLHLTDTNNNHALEVAHLKGRFQWQKQKNGWRFDMEDINFLRPGHQMLESGFSLIGRYGKENHLKLKAGITALELSDIKEVLDLFPLPEKAAAEAFAGFRPKAKLKHIQIDYEETAAATNWSVSGQVHNLWTEPWNNIPGMKNITAKIEINPARGALLLDSQQVELDFAGIIKTPVQLDHLTGLIQWQQMPDNSWHIQTHNLAAGNQDILTQTRMLLEIPVTPESSPFLDLQVDFKDGVIASTHRYLPTGIMGNGLVTWLNQSLVSGDLTSGSCVVRGRLQDFPFTNHKGRFEVLFGVENLLLNYSLDWPWLDEASTEIRFLGDSFDTWIHEGKILDSEITQAHGRIEQLSKNAPFKLKGNIKGPLKDHLRILRETPLAENSAKTVSGMRAEGYADLDVDFAIPLAVINPPPFRIDGRLGFMGSTLHFDDWQFALTKLDGDLLFDQNGIRAKDIQAMALDAPVSVDLKASSVYEDGTHITARGPIPGTTLANRLPGMGLDILNGTANWSLQLDIPGINAEPNIPTLISVESNLEGVSIDFPAPLGKQASEVRQFQLTTALSAHPLQSFQGRYGDILDTSFLLDQKNPNEPKLLRGELHLGGTTALLPDNGLHFHAKLDEFDAAPWLEMLETSSGKSPLLQPTRVDIDIQSLHSDDFELTDVIIKLDQEENNWSGYVASNLFAGDISIPADLEKEAITLRLDQLELNFKPDDELVVEKAEPPLEQHEEQESFLDPRDFPALYLQSDKLLFNGQDLGSVILDVQKIKRGLFLKPTVITSDQLTLTVTAYWQHGGYGPNSNLSLTIDTPAVGDLLAGLNFTQNIQGAAAAIDTQLYWHGGPQQISLGKTNGLISVDIDKGRILEVNPGIGRVFGLLNLTALQRRLSLDFSDLYKEGFSFDRMKGSFQLEQGNAYTKKFQIAGPAAKISVSGRAGLVDRDFDQRVTVTPQVSSSVTLATAIANPIAGAALFVAQNIMGDELNKLTSYQYQITGPWDNPVFSKKKSILLSPLQKEAESW